MLVVLDKGVNRFILYFVQINDYLQLDDVAMQKKSVLVVGGGFLGSELAVGLASRGEGFVTHMLFEQIPYLLYRKAK